MSAEWIRELCPELHDWQVELLAEAMERATCAHSIFDARNQAVVSGYACAKCGAVFAAADHGEPPAPVAQQGQAVTRESALAAMRHIEQHNGPGRWREAVAMLASTAQQTAVPLTDEAIQSILRAMPSSLSRNDWPIFFARMIEDAHGITPKENGS